ncbi:hypothetical protein NC652_000609 [Populus alba x Populus x berolinensis]|nr:hypothetical protein NC652_000609 [Populus alba x Populus x berolinensis]
MGKVSRRSAGENESIDWKKACIKEFFAENIQTSDGKKTGIYGHSGESFNLELASLLMVEASGSGQCGEDLLETMNVEEKLLRLALFLWRD